MTWGARGSHAIAKGVARGGDEVFWAPVAMAVELVVAHLMAMETGSPISYVRVWERFIVLGQGKIGGIRGVWVIQDMEVGWEHRALCPEVI